jgi:hypothetical protein
MKHNGNFRNPNGNVNPVSLPRLFVIRGMVDNLSVATRAGAPNHACDPLLTFRGEPCESHNYLLGIAVAAAMWQSWPPRNTCA